MLELDEGQLSRPVLRGRGGSNTSLLPGRSVDGSSQRGKVCARPEPAGPGGRRENSGQRIWSKWRVVREQWPVASGQWPVNAKRGAGGERKVPEQSQLLVALIVGIL